MSKLKIARANPKILFFTFIRLCCLSLAIGNVHAQDPNISNSEYSGFGASNLHGWLNESEGYNSSGTTAPLIITTPSPLPNGTPGVVYSQTFEASGGVPPYAAWNVSSGALPPGLLLNSTGVLSGTPSTVGTYTFTVQVFDNSQASAFAVFSIRIGSLTPPPPVLAGIDPSWGTPGSSVAVLFRGSGFVVNQTTVQAGAPVTVGSIDVRDATTMTAQFNISPGAAGGPVAVAVTTPNGNSNVLTFTVVTVTGISCAPNPVNGGSNSTCTVTLSGAAPPGNAEVRLSSSDPRAPVQPSVIVNAGQTTASFQVTTLVSATPYTSTLTAQVGTTSVSTNLSVAGERLGLNISPNPTTGGTPSTGTVMLAANAPLGGVRVTLSSSDPKVTVPLSVTIPAGSSSATFNLTTTATPAQIAVNITAVIDGSSVTRQLILLPPAIASFTFNPGLVGPGQMATGNVTIASPAPAPGVTLSLSCSSSIVSVPNSLTIISGATSVSFTASASATGFSSVNVTCTAAIEAAPLVPPARASLTIESEPAVTPLILSCAPSSGPSQIGGSYLATCTASGGASPYNWSVSAGTLPVGLILNSSGNSATISGPPVASGNYNYTVTVRDNGVPPNSAAQSFSGTIAGPLSLNCGPEAGPTTVGTAYIASCTVTGGTSPYNWSVDPGMLPEGLTLIPAGSSAAIRGTPVSAGNYSYTVRVTDSSPVPNIAAQAYGGTIAGILTLNCEPAAGPAGVGFAYAAACTVRGGTAPYNWSVVEGALPAGLTLRPSGSRAAVNGTPYASGNYSYRVKVTDSSEVPNAAARVYSGTITGPLTLNCNPGAGPTTVGGAYAATCRVSGGTSPYSWLMSAGTLPAGLTLSPSGASATISGTPSASGSYNYTVRVSDSGAALNLADQNYSGTITGNLSLNCNPAAGPATVGAAYSSACSVTGGTAPYSWSVNAGVLPVGLTLIPSGASATISGVPLASGNFSYTVRVTDNGATRQVAERTYFGTIAQPLSINCNPVAGPSIVGAAYTAACTVTGGISPYYWSVSAGALPVGLTLSPSGSSATISGTPSASGSFSYTVRVTDSSAVPLAEVQAHRGTIGGSITLNCSAAAGPATVGVVYTSACTVTGGTSPFNWSVSAGALPPGLVLSSSGTSAAISGIPSASGNYSYTVNVRDSSAAPNAAALAYSGTIAGLLSLYCSEEAGPATLGAGYAAACTVTGGISPYYWSVTGGALPAGLNLRASGGGATISGVASTPGNYGYTVRVTDSSAAPNVATQFYGGTISGTSGGRLSLLCNSSLGPTRVGILYSAVCAVTGGVSPYNWSVGAGALPAGLTLRSSGSTATISGTPTTSGNYSYTVRVADSSAAPNAAVQVYGGTIGGSLTLSCSPAGGPAMVGAGYAASCSVTGGTSPYNWSVSAGTLPAGLTLSPSGARATISGSPAAPGTYSYTVRVTDSSAVANAATQDYSGTIGQLVIPTLVITTQAAAPTQPIVVGLQLNEAAPMELQGTLSLAFRPLVAGVPAGYSDPALQFVTGGKTLNFIIPAGMTAIGLPQSVMIQQGTVAGDVTVSVVRLMAGAIDVTPQAPPSSTVRIPLLPPVITPNSVRIINVTANSFDVEATAYSTSRDLLMATYTFEVAAGTQISGSATLSVDMRTVADQWFANSQSLTYGSLVLLRMRFTVDGNPNSIPSVTLTLTNSAGTSSPVTGRK